MEVITKFVDYLPALAGLFRVTLDGVEPLDRLSLLIRSKLNQLGHLFEQLKLFQHLEVALEDPCEELRRLPIHLLVEN